MKLAGIFILFAIPLVRTTDVYITSPHSVITWQAGDVANIKWDIIPGGAVITALNVDLMDGDDHNAHVLQPIAAGLSPDSKSVQWKVPADFPSTKTIFVRVQSPDGKMVRYSHRFAVNGSPPANKPAEDPNKKQEQKGTTEPPKETIKSEQTNETQPTSIVSTPYSTKTETEDDESTQEETTESISEELDPMSSGSLRKQKSDALQASFNLITLLASCILFVIA